MLSADPGLLPRGKRSRACFAESNGRILAQVHALLGAGETRHPALTSCAGAGNAVGQGPGHGAAGANPQGEALAVGQVEAHAGGAHRAELGVGEGHGLMCLRCWGRRVIAAKGRRLPTRAAYHI